MPVGLVGDEPKDAVEICCIVILNFQPTWRSGGPRNDPHLSPKDPSQFRFGGADIGIDLRIRFAVPRRSFGTIEVLYAPFGFPHRPIVLNNFLGQTTLRHRITYAEQSARVPERNSL